MTLFNQLSILLKERCLIKSRFYKKASLIPLFLINSVWAIPGVMIIRCIKPWIHIRLGIITSSRIGHFVADTSIFLARSAVENRSRSVNWFWVQLPTANDYWYKLVSRRLIVRWWVRYLVTFNKLIPGGKLHHIVSPTASGSRRVYDVLRQSSVRFEFSNEEVDVAKSFLRKRGWKDNEKFVCLLVRDSAYLMNHPLHSSGSRHRWRYHNYRDSDINSYQKAVLSLIQAGYWVIRMGKIAEARFPTQIDRVIDYPFVTDQNDIVDIWLSANCQFFISTAAGIDIVPWVYGRPIVYVNALPIIDGAFPIKHIWVPKHLRWKDSGRLLKLAEHIKFGYGRTEDYETAGIVIDGLSENEIDDAVRECEMRLRGEWIDEPYDIYLQQKYWKKLSSTPEFAKNNNYLHPEARVGCSWLRSMGDNFFE